MLIALRDPKLSIIPNWAIYTPKQAPTLWDKIKGWVHLAVNVIVDIATELLVDTFAVIFPLSVPITRAIKLGISFVTGALSDLVFYGKVDWVGTATNALASALAFGITEISKLIPKGAKYISEALLKRPQIYKAFQRVARRTKQAKKVWNWLKKPMSDKILDGVKLFVDKKITPNMKLHSLIRKTITSKNIDQSVKSLKLAYSILKNPFAIVTQAISFTGRKAKPELMKKLVDIQHKQLTKGLSKAIAKNRLTPKKAQRYIRFLRTKQKRWIELQLNHRSKWLRGMRVYSEEYYDQSENVSFMLYFNDLTTSRKKNPEISRGRIKGKRPLELTLPWRDFWAFVNSSSPGKYYLDNIAWDKPPGLLRIRENKRLFFNIDQFEEIKKRFRLETINTRRTRKINKSYYQSYNQEVRKHRTNKTQLFANVKRRKGRYVVDFTKGYNSNTKKYKYRTATSKKIK
ncbi:hypothetical protein [Mycoplasmopsis sturni]|uniref:hypothetical protein n=1 Tax=Mycoplasmopsis sturni TaxID=39047 RepID=UPI0005636682|nr:hypothetical protein [Mycoplasmopsis sturni]